MGILRRIALLTAVSIAGVSVLAPLSAITSATDAMPDAVDDALLPIAVTTPAGAADRGSLSLRSAASEPRTTTERLEAGPPPTPGTAPMEATLYGVPAPPPPPTPAPAPAPASRTPTYRGDSVWDDLAQCESGGNWSINTGNGYYGGLQFSYDTWHAYGGGEFAEYPHQATRAEQIIVAERLRAARGYAPWPACRLKLGLP